MFILGDFFLAIAKVVNIALEVYKWVVIIAVLISWVNPDPYNPVVRFLHSVTGPVFRPVRRVIGYRLGPIDISPIIILLAIIFVQSFLVQSLVKIGIALGGG